MYEPGAITNAQFRRRGYRTSPPPKPSARAGYASGGGCTMTAQRTPFSLWGCGHRFTALSDDRSRRNQRVAAGRLHPSAPRPQPRSLLLAECRGAGVPQNINTPVPGTCSPFSLKTPVHGTNLDSSACPRELASRLLAEARSGWSRTQGCISHTPTGMKAVEIRRRPSGRNRVGLAPTPDRGL
jgi:hypothetical protein